MVESSNVGLHPLLCWDGAQEDAADVLPNIPQS